MDSLFISNYILLFRCVCIYISNILFQMSLINDLILCSFNSVKFLINVITNKEISIK